MLGRDAAAAPPASAGSGDAARGKELFKAKCGPCHTLADAGTKGVIGPNLDDAFRQSRADGLGEGTIRAVVRGQISYPIEEPTTGSPGMPADIVTGDDADAVAAYVASVAGLPVRGGAEAGGGTTTARRRRHDHGESEGGGEAGRRGDLRRGRLRRLPHARGRRHDRDRRPEPRRREAVEGARDRPRHERHGRDAPVQGLATRRSRSQPSPTSSSPARAASPPNGRDRADVAR